MPPSPVVSVIVGSASDSSAIASCRRTLDELEIPHEAKVLSAHRTPAELVDYVTALRDRGVKVVIAAAGMSASGTSAASMNPAPTRAGTA